MRAQWRSAGLYTGELLAEAMDAAADARGGDRLIFLSDDRERSVTVAELTRDAYVVAAGLRAHGVRAGDAIAVQLPNVVECLVAYRAAFALGATLVPVPSIYGEREVAFMLDDVGARCLISADRWRSMDYVAALGRHAARPGMRLVVVLGDTVPEGCVRWDELKRPGSRAAVAPTLDGVAPTDTALVVYTSGSTASPKGARHSHESFLYEMRQAYPPSRLDGTSWFNWLPFGHMAGCLAACRMLLFGRTTVVTDRWNARLALEAIERFNLTSGTLPPYHLITLLDAARRAGARAIDIRDCLVGSTSVPPSVITAADALGIPAYRCYGSTEHPTVTKGSPSDALEVRADTDGTVLPGCSVRIVDDQGEPLPQGVEGHVVTRGPDMFLGYTSPTATAESLTDDGYYRTGDLGTLVDGLLTITGREKDVIIRGGENLSAKEIEDVLVEHPAVREAAVVGAPDPKYGERPWAFVILSGSTSFGFDDLRRHFSEAGTARQKTPEGLTVVSDFSRTAAGKVRKDELRSRLQQDGGT